MKKQKRGKDEGQLEAHSLPGTNQAGVGPEVPADKIKDESDAEPPGQGPRPTPTGVRKARRPEDRSVTTNQKVSDRS